MSNVPESKQAIAIKEVAARALDHVRAEMRKYPNAVDTYLIFADVFGGAVQDWKCASEELSDKVKHRPEVLPDYLEDDVEDEDEY